MISIIIGLVVILILQAIMVACVWVWDNRQELKCRVALTIVLMICAIGYSLYHNTSKKMECDRLGAIVVQGTYNSLYCVKEIK